MDRVEMANKCIVFFEILAEELQKTHTVKGSCNRDISAYLIPDGTDDLVTYHSKPVNSFRISDHWNWKSNLAKNPNEKYIQCYTRDMPWCKLRQAPGKASPPVFGCAVAYFGYDELYHVVYGERFNRKTKTWEWVEADPAEVAKIAMTSEEKED